MRGPPLQPCLRFALFKWPLNKWWVIHRDPHAAAVVWTRRGGCVRSAASTLLPHSPHAARIHAAPTQPPLHNRAATTRPHATPANAATARCTPLQRRRCKLPPRRSPGPSRPHAAPTQALPHLRWCAPFSHRSMVASTPGLGKLLHWLRKKRGG